MDVGLGWRDLTEGEAARAALLLAKASRQIRAEFPSVDARILAGKLDPELVADVACDMVRRVLSVPTTQQPASQVQQSAGPFSFGVTLANPAGDMYLTKAERKKLSLSAQRAGSVDMLPPLPEPVPPVWP
jgi:hypothetical protein